VRARRAYDALEVADMMNSQEKRVQRVGVVLLVLSSLAAAPLVWAATRPVVPVAVEEAPKKAVPSPSVAPAVAEAPKAVPAKKEAPKARPAARKPHAGEAWTCSVRETVAGWNHALNRPVREANPTRVQICGWEKTPG
jgi:nucleoid-associated protein YgaU